MEIKSFFAQDAQGNIMPSAECFLYAPGTTNLISGLVDINGMPISNPFQASDIGKVQFGAPNGIYDLRMKKGVRDTTIRIQCADLLQALNETASFLGARATAPTTRADGTPLQLADRYLNTTDQIEYIYKSSGWVANNLDGQILSTTQGASLVGALMKDGSPGTVQQAINAADSGLREDLARPTGSSIVSFVQAGQGAIPRTSQDKMRDFLSVRDFGAIGDGEHHPLSERFSTLAEAQSVYSNAPLTSLSDGIDWAAVWQADYIASTLGKTVYFPAGWYRFNKTCIKRVTWQGDGVPNAWNFDGKGTLITPYGAGNPARWTDVDGLDSSNYTPLIVVGRSGCGFVRMSVYLRDGQDRWSAGVFYAGVRRQFTSDFDAMGPWSDAGVRVDATWSSLNTTLKSLHPEVESDLGCNEYSFGPGFFSGLRGIKIQGTTRPASTVPFVWAPGGTSDICLDPNLRMASAGPDAERLVDGAGFWHDAVIPNGAGVGQGINWNGATVRTGSKYAIYLDHTNRMPMVNVYCESISSWTAAYGSAINSMTSNTSAVIGLGDTNGLRWYKDGVLVGNNSSLNQWQASRVYSKIRSDGAIALPHIYGSFESSTGLLLNSFSTFGLTTLSYDDGAVRSPYLHFTNTGARPEVAGTINFGTGTFGFGVANFSEFRAAVACRAKADNTVSCGDPAFRWTQVCSVNGNINTSDARFKTPIRKMTEKEVAAGCEIGESFGLWQWKDRAEEEGDLARTHAGTTVQEAISILEKNGLDPYSYSFICYDKWDDKYETIDAIYEGTGEYDEKGIEQSVLVSPETQVLIKPAGDIFSFRSNELLAFVIAAFFERDKKRSVESADIKSRLEAIEATMRSDK